MLSSLSPPRRRLMLALAAVCALLVVVVLVSVVPARLSEPTVAAQDQPGPVLLVPGYGGSRASLEVLATSLRAAGRTATVLTLPGDGTGDLTKAAEVLNEAADAALAAGAPSVDVVGYSAGGVTARWWVAELDGDAVTRRVVTLGSPHRGAEIAGLGAAIAPDRCPAACRQLAPGSDLLRRLNDGDPTPDGPRWMSVWTQQDEVVTPPDSARLQGATNVVVQQVCPGVPLTHGDLPRSSLVAALVLEALAVAPPPASYGPADCARLAS